MSDSFSIEEAAKGTTVNRSSGFLVRLFKNRLHAQFKNIKHGCIILNENNSKIIFGDEGDHLKTEVTIFSNEFYILAGSGGEVGVAEAYAAGYWDSEDMVKLIQIVIKNKDIQRALDGGVAKMLSPINKIIHKFRKNTISGSKNNITAHYDLSNDFFQKWLDKSMTYSCAVFEPKDISLYDASIEKIRSYLQKDRA